MQSVLALGLGKSGLAAARHALERGDELTVYAGASTPQTLAAGTELESRGARVIFDSEDVQGSYDLCVVSPGIPQTGAFYKSALAASAELVSEPEWAWRLFPGDWIAVTGTNGKTTTTALVTYLLNASGHAALSCGNIGNTCIAAASARSSDETLVTELSSYQLASTSTFAPRVAVLLNITPDHLSWHGGFEAYAQAKFKVFENMGPDGTAIVTAEVLDAYPELARSIEARGTTLVRVGDRRAESCAFPDETGMLVCVRADGSRVELARADELKIRGAHNVENALCAASAALAFGCAPDGVRRGLLEFEALEHRIEPCGELDGVSYFNDSKATNVDATLKALTAFPEESVVLLLGGRDKGTDLAELVRACEGSCCAVVVYGEAAERFARAFEGSGLACHREQGMRQAFDRARAVAQPGQSVLLSPACASFDEFDSFEQRGEVFKECVARAAKA